MLGQPAPLRHRDGGAVRRNGHRLSYPSSACPTCTEFTDPDGGTVKKNVGDAEVS